MDIRRLKPEDRVEYHAICQSVFFDIERHDVREMRKNPTEYAKDDPKARFGIFDVSGKLQSALLINPFEMRMNGKNIKMGGLGAVVTRPESRGLGHMEALVRTAFEDMREKNQIFSFIYPFSFAYYRKFGYETCYAYNKVKIPLEQLRGYHKEKREAEAIPYEPGDSIKPFADIYQNFIIDRNLSIIRSENDWAQILDRDPYKDLQFTYHFRMPNGCAASYVLYEAEHDAENGNRLIINEFCWRTPSAFHDVMHFISKLGAEFEEVHWNIPSDIDIFTLFPEAFNMEHQLHATGMNRVIDVCAALETLHAPSGSGGVIIAVNDKFLPNNTGVYSVEWESEILSVKKSRKANPDAELSAETLAQLITGYATPETVAYKKDVTINGAFSKLKSLFPKRHLFIVERY
ncbi:MAG: GNAT family N-acetyltransferase [Clostridiales bacterium]|jgi:predicted acetyltransferase|nr:GNAT family N-acetyltransferase [Clostridiales bacterium]